jgi:quinol monooxygenase YgiN
MSVEDSCCSIVPYFQVHEGKMEAFKQLCEQFVTQTRTEAKCLYYGFCFHDNIAHCREGYEDAEGVLAHLENVNDLLTEALQISDLIRLEIHGNQTEIDKLRQPLAEFQPDFFILEYGFRN